MSDEELLLFNDIYNQTQHFGRTQFVREIMKLQQENKQLKEEIKKINSIIDKQDRDIVTLSKGNKQLKERINKAIEYLEYNNETLYTYEPDYDYEENMVDNYNISNYREDLLDMLKEVE